MDQDYMTMRVWKRTHKNLRIIAANQEEKIVETLDRLANEELRRIEALKDRKTKEPEQD